MRSRTASRGPALIPSALAPSDVITGPVPVIPIGKTPRLTGRDGRVKPGHDGGGCDEGRCRTKVSAGRGPVQDEGRCDPGQCPAPPRHHRSRLVITGPCTLRRHHRARPGDPDAKSTAPLSSVMAGNRAGHDGRGHPHPGLDRGISSGDLDWMKRPSLSASGWSGRAWFQMRVYVEKLSCSSAPARPAGRTLGPDRSGPDCGSAPGSRRRSPYSAGPCHRPAG
jgi:hypothetical protein